MNKGGEWVGEDETEAVALQVGGSVEASRCAQELSSGLRRLVTKR